MTDRTDRRSAGPTVIAADQNYVGVRFGDASCDSTDADFGDKLYRDSRVRIRVLQVIK